jgi:hypothetical protein
MTKKYFFSSSSRNLFYSDSSPSRDFRFIKKFLVKNQHHYTLLALRLWWKMLSAFLSASSPFVQSWAESLLLLRFCLRNMSVWPLTRAEGWTSNDAVIFPEQGFADSECEFPSHQTPSETISRRFSSTKDSSWACGMSAVGGRGRQTIYTQSKSKSNCQHLDSLLFALAGLFRGEKDEKAKKR